MPMRRAYVRGIAACLADAGILKFAQEEDANAIADATAEAIPEEGQDELMQAAMADAALAGGGGGGMPPGAEGGMPPGAEGGMPPGAEGGMPPMGADAPSEGLAMEPEEVAALAEALANITGKAASAHVMLAEKKANAEDMQKLAAHGPTKLAHVNIALAQYHEEVKTAQAAKGIGMGEPSVEGPLIDGKPTKADTLAVAAKQTPEAGLEAGQRPENYANEGEAGVGTTPTNIGMGAGMTGVQVPHPDQPPNSAPQASEVVDVPAQKEGALKTALHMIKTVKSAQATAGIGMGDPKVEGPLIDGQPTNPIDLAVAAKQTPEAALEEQERPKNYANQGEAGVGTTATALGEGAGYVGTAAPHPNQPPNTAPQASQVISFVGKTAEEYKDAFDKMARIAVPLMPASMPDAEKVAAVQDLMKLATDEEKAQFLAKMQGDKREAEGEAAESDPEEAEKKEEEEAEKEATARLTGMMAALSS